MSMKNSLPAILAEGQVFTHRDFVDAMSAKYKMTSPQIAYDLQKRIDAGTLVRIGWNQYTVQTAKQRYSPSYSNFACQVAALIENTYVGLNFQILELIQLNEFMNHQTAHNTIFVFVENDLQSYVFDALKQFYPGRVMLRPGIRDYYQYLQDDQIVILRLPSETPKGFVKPWHVRLEKIFVDILTDKLISRIVPEGEKNTIIQNAVSTYLIDTNTMIRYAKRKGAEEKFRRSWEACEVIKQ